MPGTITLITDFGLEDGHVGAMKGVVRSIAPEVTIVDISHLIAFIDSEGFLAIAVRNGNAARKLGAQEGDQVLLRQHCCADSY